MTTWHDRRPLTLLALVAILLLAAYLRLANVATNPAWYTDEGTHLDIARHLLAGRIQYLAINQSWLLVSRLPLFEMLLAALASVWGVSMETLRLLTGSLGTITVFLLFLMVYHLQRDRVLALLAALLLALYPPAVLYGRFGFSYNLLAPLMLSAVWGLSVYTQSRSKRWLGVSGPSIGLGTISDVWAFVLLVPLVVLVLFRHWRDVIWSLPLALLPFVIYAAIMLLAAPQAFLFDLHFVLSRLNQLALAQQVQTLWQNITTLATQDVWLLLGAIGWLLSRRPVRWVVASFVFIPIVLLGRTTALFSLSYYYMIPLFPLVVLGVASLIANLIRRFRAWSVPLAFVIVVSISLPLSISTWSLISQVQAGFSTDIAGFLLDPASAQQAAQFVNQRVPPDELVIASPTLTWLLQARVADMQLPSAYRGRATPHFPADIPADRWAFAVDYHQARFVIVDNLWHNWAVPNVPGVANMLSEIEAWPLVFRSGAVTVYQNPEE